MMVLGGIVGGIIAVTMASNVAIDRAGLNFFNLWNTTTTIDHLLAAARPATVFIGSSRSSLFPVDDPALLGQPTPRLRFPVFGAPFQDMVNAFVGAGGLDDAKLIVFGLDFFGFNAFYETTELIHPTDRSEALRQYVRYTAPVSTLADRLGAIGSVALYQLRKVSALANGRIDEFNEAAKPKPAPEEQPYRDIFERSARSFSGAYIGNKYGSYRLDYPGAGYSPAFSALDQLLSEAKSRGVRILFFVHPSHAWDLEIIRRSGAWEQYEEWKSRLAAAISSAQAAGAPVALWDFSGYNCVTTETVPAFGRMRWHHDVAHYNQAVVAPVILARMLGKTPSALDSRDGSCDSRSFGIELTRANVQSVLAETRRAQPDYERSHPDDMALLDRIWQEKPIRSQYRRLW
jgi:hypothetical protein